MLAAWLCYHARHNEVYFDGRLLSNSPIPPGLSFSELPDLAGVGFVATRDRITDLKVPGVSCVTSVDDVPGESRNDAHVRYLLGPPARLRFLAVRPISVNLKMRLTRRSTATAFPIDFLLTDAQGHVFEGEISGNNREPLPMKLPKGLSFLELSVKAKGSDSPAGQSVFPNPCPTGWHRVKRCGLESVVSVVGCRLLVGGSNRSPSRSRFGLASLSLTGSSLENHCGLTSTGTALTYSTSVARRVPSTTPVQTAVLPGSTPLAFWTKPLTVRRIL